MARHKRNPYHKLPRHVQDELRDICPGERLYVPRYERDELWRRDMLIRQRFTHMTKDEGRLSCRVIEVLARSFHVCEKSIERIVYGPEPVRPETPQPND